MRIVALIIGYNPEKTRPWLEHPLPPQLNQEGAVEVPTQECPSASLQRQDGCSKFLPTNHMHTFSSKYIIHINNPIFNHYVQHIFSRGRL